VSFWSRGGVSQVLTQPGAEQPTPQRPAQGDVPSGMFLAGGICAALVHVLRTGKGIVVDTSLLNAATWTLGPDMAYASVAGAQMPQPGTSAPRSPLTHMYRTADGRFVGLMMLDDDRYWAPTCRALGLDELVAAYPDEASRRPDLEKLRQQFQDVIAGLDRAGAESRLRAAGCIYSVVAAPQEVVDDPAVVDNGYLMSHPSHPPLRLPAAPAQFDDELPVMRLPGPDLGEHTAEVLSDLGYTTAEIDRLVDAGTVIVAP
jgi:crotonobetainyl-CoA:carnitine CoA-transferase CaiB-like acyl-CoA transferase